MSSCPRLTRLALGATEGGRLEVKDLGNIQQKWTETMKLKVHTIFLIFSGLVYQGKDEVFLRFVRTPEVRCLYRCLLKQNGRVVRFKMLACESASLQEIQEYACAYVIAENNHPP